MERDIAIDVDNLENPTRVKVEINLKKIIDDETMGSFILLGVMEKVKMDLHNLVNQCRLKTKQPKLTVL